MFQSPLSSFKFATFRAAVIDTLTQDIELLLDWACLPSPLHDACLYATKRGKRVRPLLVAGAWYDAMSEQGCLPADGLLVFPDMLRRSMLAVELTHAYSLIHDDLPCMDDDDLRRGQPTCHIKFGEATALLAGDVLQTLAFEVLSADIDGFKPVDAQTAHALVATFAACARRMVAGQMQDILAENTQILQHELEAIHRDKTGALIEAAVVMGGHCADTDATYLDALQRFGAHIGLAFQVQDDVLDATGTTQTLGKPAGGDVKLAKSTYVKLLGSEAASAYAESLFDAGTSGLSDAFVDAHALLIIATWLWQRQH